jgi:hypothetical protein
VLEHGSVASAVNQFKMTNSATGNAPKLETTGGDSDIDMEIEAKGDGKLKPKSGTLQAPIEHTPSGGGTATLDLADGNWHRITMPSGNITVALTNAEDGDKFFVEIVQDATGSRTVTWFSNISWDGGSAPTLSTTGNKVDVFAFKRTSSTKYLGFVVGQGH